MSLRRSRGPLAAVAAAGTIAFLGVSCGGGGSPSTPTPSSTPTPLVTPSPPTGGGGAGSSHCPLGKGSVGAVCAKGTARLTDAVFAAQDSLVQTKPQLFDKTQEAGKGTGQYLVLDQQAYLNGIVSNLTAAGFCAQRDPDDYNYEVIQVKNENDFSESYDVLSGAGYMRRSGIYRDTCTPASFPVDRGDAPPPGSGCGKPYPPPITRFRVKVHIPGEIDMLDSTALVGPDPAYCALIGYGDGRSNCPVRIEGSPERTACETWAVGYATDTGRPGPTWTRQPDGTLCTGTASGCANHENNQYELYVTRGGTYRATGRNGAYGEVYVDRPQ